MRYIDTTRVVYVDVNEPNNTYIVSTIRPIRKQMSCKAPLSYYPGLKVREWNLQGYRFQEIDILKKKQMS